MVLTGRERVPRNPVNPYVVRPIEGSERSLHLSSPRPDRAPVRGSPMRRSLATALLGTLLAVGHASGQILDETLVPRGYLRLQAHPVYTSWDSRYGRAADGSESTESLGDDLTDPTGLSLFPGIATLAQILDYMKDGAAAKKA